MKASEVDWILFQMLEHVQFCAVGKLIRAVECVQRYFVSGVLQEFGKCARRDLHIFGAAICIRWRLLVIIQDVAITYMRG